MNTRLGAAQNTPQPQTELGRLCSHVTSIAADVNGLSNGSIAALDEALTCLAETVRSLDREISRLDVL